MATEEKLTINERYKLVRMRREQYWAADRKGRSSLLNELEAITHMHRKSLIRLLRGGVQRKRRRRQRGRSYGPEVDDAIRVISESMDHVCAERMHPNLVSSAKHLAHHGEISLTEGLLDQLDKISISTVRRILERVRQDEPKRVRKRATPRVSFRHIPAKRLAWDLKEPGYFEVDLVHHSGDTVSGEYVHTLQMIDVATGWSERVAVLGRSYLVMRDGFERILRRLPFPVLELHPDNGSEFLNHHLLTYWTQEILDLELSRSRPYQKNDNRFVEQKNSSLVRAYLGNERFDTVAHTNRLNRFYDGMWVFYNLFQPVMRLSGKEVVPTTNGIHRVKRRYDDAKTPFERLLATGVLSTKQSAQLKVLHRDTNPRSLRNELYRQRDAIFDLPAALAGQSQDVRQTLKTKTSQKEKNLSHIVQKGDGGPVTLSND